MILNVPADFWLPEAMSWAVMCHQLELVRHIDRKVGHSHWVMIPSWGLGISAEGFWGEPG